jgi:glycosyltransferase involved in cell wall biosynthesis
MNREDNRQEADICLVIEGCYPFITGGVSSWVHRLIKTYEGEFTFYVVSLVAGVKTEEDMRYPKPDNVVDVLAMDITDYSELKNVKVPSFSKKELKHILSSMSEKVCFDFMGGKLPEKQTALLKDILYKYGYQFFKYFLNAEPGFEVLTEIYSYKHDDDGFINYYYNWRNIHLLVWRIFMLIRDLPPARIYHAPGTGFAGFLCCLMTELHQKASVITEHGIYMQERDMDLSVASWLKEDYLRDMWRDFYLGLTKFQYGTVTEIITLYNGNRLLAAEYGADAEKIQVIPNGIQIDRFEQARFPRLTGERQVMGIVGRVDSVKDIKTFINVVALVKDSFPNVYAYIVGPKEEDEGYFNECVALTKLLKIEDYVEFTGPQDVVEYFKKFDVLLLTSVKEAMPLTVMEGMASGVPVVATRVGACEELLNGSGEDKLGIAGYVATIMDSQDIAMKTIKILRDPELANRMAQVGIQRIEKYYPEDILEVSYREIYNRQLKINPETECTVSS